MDTTGKCAQPTRAKEGFPLTAKTPQTICFRASDDDRAIVQAVANFEGLSLSAFARAVVLEYCRAHVEEHGIDKLAAALSRTDEQQERQRRLEESAATVRKSLEVAAIAKSGKS